MADPAPYPPIGDYAVIGNGHSAALVSRAGSIDWWCPMRFDRPAVFAALLDARCGGRFRIRPTQPFETRRRYVGETNVLETTFFTETGVAKLVDAMPIAAGGDGQDALQPHHAVIRAVEGVEGEVAVDVLYEPRFAYGASAARISDRKALGFWCTRRGEALSLRSEVLLDLSPDGARAHGRATLSQGTRRYLALTFARGEPLVLSPLGEDAQRQIDRTVRWWNGWAARCRYDGPYRAAVVRSALVLKLMAYAPSGAIVAAPTTSLPEEIGGSRNWDYRYCWLRDATLTMRALLELGYQAEAGAFLQWLLQATHLTWPELRVLYDVFGHTDLEERELGHLAGYKDSRPVRIGNDAAEQRQLDVYGEVIGAAHEYVMRGGRLAKSKVRALCDLGETVCSRWQEPDAGLWERRSQRHHVYSKVMCWRALDNLLTMHAHGHLQVPAERFRRVRDAIHGAVEAEGYSEEAESYVQTFGSQTADASLLLLPTQGFAASSAPRMQSTYAYLKAKLSVDGLWYRYPPGEDGLEGRDGTFGICSFWAVEYLARSGKREAATEAFEHVLECANDVGLFAEEIDPETRAALGNFPQAFTHIGLINAALALVRSGEAAKPSSAMPTAPNSGR